MLWIGGRLVPAPPPAIRRVGPAVPPSELVRVAPAMPATELVKAAPAMLEDIPAVPEPQTPPDMPGMPMLALAPAEVPLVKLGEPAVPASPKLLIAAVATAKKSPPAVPPEPASPAHLPAAAAAEPAGGVAAPAAEEEVQEWVPEAQDVPMGPAEEIAHGRPPPDDEPAAQRGRIEQVRAWIPNRGWMWVVCVEDLPAMF